MVWNHNLDFSLRAVYLLLQISVSYLFNDQVMNLSFTAITFGSCFWFFVLLILFVLLFCFFLNRKGNRIFSFQIVVLVQRGSLKCALLIYNWILFFLVFLSKGVTGWSLCCSPPLITQIMDMLMICWFYLI